jgi:15-cis-phytoene synthase
MNSQAQPLALAQNVARPAANFSHAANHVRNLDHDRYLGALFAPGEARQGLFALYAFNAEIARIRDVVTEPLAGEMRLQWWRDTLAGERAEGEDHPVAAALIATIKRYNLPIEPFIALIEARSFDLYDDPMPTWRDLEGYCGETSAAIMRLASLILAGGRDPGSAALSGHAGMAYALTGLLRAFPWHARRQQCFLPHELLLSEGASPESIFEGQETPELLMSLKLVRERAREHLAALRKDITRMDRVMAPAFYPVCLVEPYLDSMERADYRPFQSVIDISPLRKLWLIGRGRWLSKRCPSRVLPLT